MAALHNRLVCAVMAGGSGTRFWPLSTKARPKQLLPLMSDKSLLEETLERVRPLCPPDRVVVITSHRLVDAVRESVPEVPSLQIVGEPVPRNTAPCFELAAIMAQSLADDALVALLPADHHVGDPQAFRDALVKACDEADRGAIVTLGVRPSRPETGYGYIEVQPQDHGVYDVQRFTEKPALDVAMAYLKGGRHLWNAGVFVVRADVARAAVERHLPALSEALAPVASASQRGLSRDFHVALATHFERCPSISVDYGVMERETDLRCVPLDAAWSDVGTWQSLLDHRSPGALNYERGDVIAQDCEGCVLVSEGPVVTAVGLRDVAVVATEGAVLALPVERSQDVRDVVKALSSRPHLT